MAVHNNLLFVNLCLYLMFTWRAVHGTHNLTNFLQHRQRRWLIFKDSGSMKFSIGPSMPVPLEDPVRWRSFVLSYNLQGGQYSLPTTPIYPWDKWEDTFARSLQKHLRNIEYRTASGVTRYEDDTKRFVYTALEAYMERRSGNGRQCLLRSICENAQVQEHIGVFSEILDIVLTPGKANLTEDYHDAYAAGKAGANCLSQYNACPRGANLLDEYLIVHYD